MNANKEDAHELLQAIETIIRQYEQAVETAKQTQEEAHKQRERSLSVAQQRFSEQRNQADGALREINTSAQEAKQTLDKLGIKANKLSSISTATQSTVRTTELLRTLQNRRVEVRRLANQLRNLADELEAERKKWWKFW